MSADYSHHILKPFTDGSGAMSEPSIGQCFTLGRLKETGVVYDSSCMVDVLDTAIHVVFVFIFGIWIVYLNRKESPPDRNGFYHKHHIGRWLLSCGIVLASIAAFMEGILTGGLQSLSLCRDFS